MEDFGGEEGGFGPAGARVDFEETGQGSEGVGWDEGSL